MNFVVTYRCVETGAKKTVEIEADSRAEVFVEIKKRGINAISVSEGKQARTSSGLASIRRYSAIGVLAIVLALLGGLVAIFFTSERGKGLVREVKEIKGKTFVFENASQVEANPDTEKLAEVEEKPLELPPPPKDPKEVVQVLFAQTNSTGVIEDVVVRADGTRVRRVYDPRPVVFLNPCDQAIVTVLSIKPGQEIPPTPMDVNLEEAFEESLRTPIEINEDDSPEVKAQKLLVMETRQEIAELRKDGRKVADILNEHVSLHNANTEIRNDAMRELRDYVRTGDKEGAQVFLNAINTALEQIGADPIDMPQSPAERRLRNKLDF